MVLFQICVTLLWIPAHAEAFSASIIMNQIHVPVMNSFMADAMATLTDSVQFLSASPFAYIKRNLYLPEMIPVFLIYVRYIYLFNIFLIEQRIFQAVDFNHDIFVKFI